MSKKKNDDPNALGMLTYIVVAWALVLCSLGMWILQAWKGR
jgi:hypothetical protein